MNRILARLIVVLYIFMYAFVGILMVVLPWVAIYQFVFGDFGDGFWVGLTWIASGFLAVVLIEVDDKFELVDFLKVAAS